MSEKSVVMIVFGVAITLVLLALICSVTKIILEKIRERKEKELAKTFANSANNAFSTKNLAYKDGKMSYKDTDESKNEAKGLVVYQVKN